MSDNNYRSSASSALDAAEIAKRLGSATALATGEWSCKCPAHEDSRASLSLGEQNGRLLWHCHAGCSQEQVEEALRGLALLPPRSNGDARRTKSKLGPIVTIYDYCDARGALVFQVTRHRPKDFRQRRPDPKKPGEWIWNLKGIGQRPLYRLPELLAADPAEPVYVVEGEKDVDRLRSIGLIATTSSGGAGNWKHTDPGPLAGRHIVLVPDHDPQGHGYVAEVARGLKGKAASLRLLELPGLDAKQDASDWLDRGGTVDELRRLADAAPAYEPPPISPNGPPKVEGEIIQGRFRVLPDDINGERAGVYYLAERKGDDDELAQEWRWLTTRVDVLAETCDEHGKAWGRLLAIHANNGMIHQWAMPMAMMAGSGEEYRRGLLDLGMAPVLSNTQKNRLGEYLSQWKPDARVRCTDRVGWHQRAFVLPDCTYGDTGDDGRLLLQIANGVPREFHIKGTLAEWRDRIARLAIGNSRLTLSISTAFAGPLILLAGEESGGIHLFGQSSIGKTAGLHAARSVWGLELGTWRTTANAVEISASDACDTLMVLDEMGQGTAENIETMAYLLGNQRGKSRMSRAITNRPTLKWRILFISTGEVGLATKLSEIGKHAKAGQAVRVVEIPGDAGAGLGAFENLHSFTSGADLAKHLREEADRQCGHPGRAFLGHLTADYDQCHELVNKAVELFIVEQCPRGADGQVRRVCSRFGLIAAAGELATKLGIVPWPKGTAEEAAVRCFKDWITHRGGTDPAEITAGIRAVRLFLELHGSSRFDPAWVHAHEGKVEAALHRTINRAGFRREAEGGGSTYYVLPEAWAAEVCKGFDASLIARAMIEHGWMEKGDGNHLAKRESIPGWGRHRLYVIKPAFLVVEDDDKGQADADR